MAQTRRDNGTFGKRSRRRDRAIGAAASVGAFLAFGMAPLAAAPAAQADDLGVDAFWDFFGLGDSNTISWGSILYWAQQNQALLVGAWWTFIPPGVCIALVGLSLTLINYAIDEITNPRLKGEGA